MIEIEKIRNALNLEADGLISGRMVATQDCGHTGRCAVGALLSAAGIEDGKIDQWGLDNVWPGFLEVLSDTYGLSKRNVDSLMSFNDGGCGIQASDRQVSRLNAVKGFVSGMYAAQVEANGGIYGSML